MALFIAERRHLFEQGSSIFHASNMAVLLRVRNHGIMGMTEASENL